MQATEKYSDRRHNKRRHVKRRRNARSGNSRRSNPRRCDARRNDARLNLTFEVSILDHNGKTVNVSARGVYLELATNNFEVFPTGASILLQINVATNTSDGGEKKFLLFGRGTVITNCIIENPDHTNSLGVALKFTEQLNTELDYD